MRHPSDVLTYEEHQGAAVQYFGRYEVQEKLGQGSFAAVYRGWDPLLRRPVAIKMLLPGWVEDTEIRNRFTTESQMLAGLRHPHIVTVHDVGETEGRPFFTMELVDGPTLEGLLAKEGPLPPHRVSAILDELASAVDYLHGQQLVHRDIKPANVMLDPSGRVVLMDFNIARSLEATRLTSTGAYLGTPGASAPEQILGRPVGPAADIYALGVLAYQLLSGRPPFAGDLARVGYAIVHEAPPSIDTLCPGLSPAAAAAIHAALAKQPQSRPSPARAFAEAFAGRAPTQPSPRSHAPAPVPSPTLFAYGQPQAGSAAPPRPSVPPVYHPPPPGPFPGAYPTPGIQPPHMAGPWQPRPRPGPYRAPAVLALGWVVGTVIGGILGALAIRGLDSAIEGTGGLEVFDEAQLFLLRFLLAGLYGCLLGLGQAPALPLRGGSRFLWWLVTALGFSLAYPSAFRWGDPVVELVVDPFADPTAAWTRFRIFFVVGALIGAGVSLLQALTLASSFRNWWLWPAVSTAALGLAMGLAYATRSDGLFFFAEYDAGLIVTVTLIYTATSAGGLLLLGQRRSRAWPVHQPAHSTGS